MQSYGDISWDKETDVLVMGFGFAGALAAISAKKSGDKVLVVEKMKHPGGNSRMSGGAFRIAYDSDAALLYLRRTCLNTVPDDLLREFAKGMSELSSLIEDLASQTGYTVRSKHTGGTYPTFPGSDAFGYLRLKAPASKAEPHVWMQRSSSTTSEGWSVFMMLEEIVDRMGIEVMTSTAGQRLLVNNERAIGIVAKNNSNPMFIKARKGVVLASGGFENNQEMKLQYFHAQPVFPVVCLGNMGDGIIMAQEAGAALWHMWHFHGSYGFKSPNFPVAFRHFIGGGRADQGITKMPWILVDKLGRRYMNEYPMAIQDTAWRAMCLYDSDLQDFPRIPSYMILDEEARLTHALFLHRSDDLEIIPSYDWSSDNSEEIRKGWIKSSDNIQDLVRQINLDPKRLELTVKKWNEACEKGEDVEYGRPQQSMMPILKSPFYAVEVWPIVTNTQGGLAHDRKQRVLNSFGETINGLYVAGEMGGIFGHLYLQAGNNSEAFITGKTAGTEAAKEEPWE